MNESKYRRIADEYNEPSKEPEPETYDCECGYTVDWEDDHHLCDACGNDGCKHCMTYKGLYWYCKDGCE